MFAVFIRAELFLIVGAARLLNVFSTYLCICAVCYIVQGINTLAICRGFPSS